MQSLRRDDFPLLSCFEPINGRDINEVAGMGLCFRNFFASLSFKDFKKIFPFRWHSLKLFILLEAIPYFLIYTVHEVQFLEYWRGFLVYTFKIKKLFTTLYFSYDSHIKKSFIVMYAIISAFIIKE